MDASRERMLSAERKEEVREKRSLFLENQRSVEATKKEIFGSRNQGRKWPSTPTKIGAKNRDENGEKAKRLKS